MPKETNQEAPPSPRFHRRREDFTCLQCGTSVTGDGFTNHCPACLWSRHVDVFPGDRAAECGGMMEPIRAEYRGGEFTLFHQCVQCGHARRNRSATGDDRDTLIGLSVNR